ncbi:dodecin [Marinovum sp.]|uniref:dodecin n=1 Tax=Marinovum sp. TaxID=2024839 RepID=UPI002B26B68E|nr:dodecin [Marinovum sp.]
MSHVYPVTEVYGSSTDSIDDAVKQAVRTASRSLRHVEWFEVTDIRGHVKDGEVAHFQVGVKLGFRLERDGDDS